MSNTTSQPVSIWLGTKNKPLTVKITGGIIISRDTDWSGVTRYEKILLASFEMSSSQLPYNFLFVHCSRCFSKPSEGMLRWWNGDRGRYPAQEVAGILDRPWSTRCSCESVNGPIKRHSPSVSMALASNWRLASERREYLQAVNSPTMPTDQNR